MGEQYWITVVLPSVKLPDKATYNWREARTILDCSKMTLWRKVKSGEIRMTPSKKFYRQELINYLCSNHQCNDTPDIKP